jgi:hypothetical protein
MNSTLAQACALIFARAGQTDWVEPYVSGCAEDMSLIGMSPIWITSAMQALQFDVGTPS